VASLYGHDALEGGEEGSVWPALSDLLAATTLIFCVLFAVTVVPAIRINETNRALRSSLDSLHVKLSTRDVQVQRVGDYLRLTIGGDVVFPQRAFELADMNPLGRAKLDALAATLRDSSMLEKIDQIQVVGHTSSEGSDDENWRLSSRRAGTVAIYLVTQGLPACRVTALGRGRFYPLNPAQARRDARPNPQDRRIEIEIRPVVLDDTAQKRRRAECVERAGRVSAGEEQPRASVAPPKAPAAVPDLPSAAAAAAPREPRVTPRADTAGARTLERPGRGQPPGEADRRSSVTDGRTADSTRTPDSTRTAAGTP
jgi:outer membrane protein OmpA-like peptidoglycan-associated protein